MLKGIVSNLIISVAFPAKGRELKQSNCKFITYKSCSYQTASINCNEIFSPVSDMHFRTIFSSVCDSMSYFVLTALVLLGRRQHVSWWFPSLAPLDFINEDSDLVMLTSLGARTLRANTVRESRGVVGRGRSWHQQADIAPWLRGNSRGLSNFSVVICNEAMRKDNKHVCDTVYTDEYGHEFIVFVALIFPNWNIFMVYIQRTIKVRVRAAVRDLPKWKSLWKLEKDWS